MAKKKRTSGGITALKIHKRLVLMFVVVLFLFCVIVLRLGYLQIVKADEYGARALELQTREFTMTSERGSIYDANMQTLAVNQAGYTIWLAPADIEAQEEENSGYKKKLAKELAKILDDYTADEILDALDTESKTVRLEKYVEEPTYQKIKELIDDGTLPAGISSAETTRRYYPKGEFASHIIGITNDDNNGIFGIEKYYDQYLNGSEGKRITTTDASGRSLVTGIERYYPAEEGLSAVLTIDEVVQSYTEAALKESYYSKNALKAMAIVMDPKTGYILGMASYPDFDLNDPRTPLAPKEESKLEKMTDEEKLQYWTGTMWRNPMVSDTYEPGSPFKLLTTSMAIEEGVANINSTFVCRRTLMVDGTPLHCWSSVGHGGETLAQGVANSCNPVFMTMALRAGYDTFYKYLDLFGFTSRTGIDFPAESGAIVRAKEDTHQVELATMSYGHGISTTMIQMATALTSIGNGGQMMRPRLVSKLINAEGETIVENKPEVIRQVFSKSTADEMCMIMEGVVNGGTGKTAYIKGYHIGGKTGTSNKPGKGGYTDEVWSSFFAMAPMQDPKVSVLVVVDGPQTEHSGGKVAGPVVRQILADVLPYLNVEQNYGTNPISASAFMTVAPDVTGMAYADAVAALKAAKLEPIVCPEGAENFIVNYQYPPYGTSLEQGSSVCLYAG